ncbi:MAG: prephenate dehydratase [Myxococcales bacterium]|jgi:chorismate mutase/prephenate dehydratase
MGKDELDQFRRGLDAVDGKILEAVAERQALIEQVARLKAQNGIELRDLLREEAQLSRLSDMARERGLSAYFVKRLFREILDYSVRQQQQHLVDMHNPDRIKERVVVAYQGTDGAYSQIAAEQHFGGWAGELACEGHETFAAMLAAVSSGAADYGMLPVENTTAGSINDAYDLLANTTLSAVGEEVLKVEHCLVALRDVPVEQIAHVYSHPQALAQCSVFLSGLKGCMVEAFTDTAMSVEKVRDEGDPTQAAIASERAASLYGLQVIARDIANQAQNYTRFLVVAREALRFDERIPCKTSLIFSTRHERGALVRCLNLLADRNLNLTKLESRPRLHSPFEYLFYVDFEGNLESEEVQAALEGMREHTSSLKVLGSYPAHGGPGGTGS